VCEAPLGSEDSACHWLLASANLDLSETEAACIRAVEHLAIGALGVP
jgi:hypothetical protein